MLIDIATFDSYNNLGTDVDIDPLKTLVIDSACNEVVKYLGYNPEAKTYTSTVDGQGEYYIRLDARPINSISSVVVDGVSLSPTDFVYNSNLLYHKSHLNVFNKGFNNVVVGYNAGYSTLPSDIKIVALEIASLLWMEKSGNIGITSRADGDLGSRTFFKTTDFLPYLRRLSSYRIF